MLLPSLNAKICPLENHYVCNKDVPRHSCVCALIKSEEPAPEKSCNLVANIVNNEFEASSITFNLDDSSEQFNTFPEVAFKKEIASALKVKVSDIVIVRLRCTDSDKKLTVQFLILKENNTVMQINVSTLKTILSKKKGLKSLLKAATEEEEEEDDDKSEIKESNDSKDESDEDDDGKVEKTEENNDDSNKDDSVEDSKDDDKDDSSNDKENSKDDDDEKDDDDDDDSEKSNDNDDVDNDDESKEMILYEQNDFIDSDIIVKKMKTMGHLSQIAELDVDEIQVVKNLFDIENDTGNFILFVQAVFLIVAVLMTCVCGCYMSCRKSEYSDDLQKV
uniref:PITH domain-containing protein n=1 Tax=Strongyloides venezuelensis TaxID=75913 RepID=A0A0K0FWL0_STRVS